MTNWTEETIKEHIFTDVQCRYHENDEWTTGKLIGYFKNYDHPFCIRHASGTDRFYEMRLMPKKKWIDWTPETVPFPLALRRKDWPKGVCNLFDIKTDLVASCATDNYGISYHKLKYSELNHEESEWETRDGKRCGVEVSE